MGQGIKFMEVFQSKQFLGSKLETNFLKLGIDWFFYWSQEKEARRKKWA